MARNSTWMRILPKSSQQGARTAGHLEFTDYSQPLFAKTKKDLLGYYCYKEMPDKEGFRCGMIRS